MKKRKSRVPIGDKMCKSSIIGGICVIVNSGVGASYAGNPNQKVVFGRINCPKMEKDARTKAAETFTNFFVKRGYDGKCVHIIFNATNLDDWGWDGHLLA